ncbi:hypothetical protein H4Q26_013531 [Puccinia striiformis f. sp. tritici PST-130]|nr:hypothetical protein H4Q26_013531 [Puccinia striiformis f. sp. tritici PST-130]
MYACRAKSEIEKPIANLEFLTKNHQERPPPPPSVSRNVSNYAIYTSPNHQPIPDHLPTLIITHRANHTKYYTPIYTRTTTRRTIYSLLPDQGDLCVAKLFPPNNEPTRTLLSLSLLLTVQQSSAKLPEFEMDYQKRRHPKPVSKPNPNCPWWTLFYFTYAGHLIPPKRIEFGKIVKAQPNGPKSSGETKITVTGILVCAALNVLDEEISKAAEAAGVQLSARPSINRAQVPTTHGGAAAPVPPNPQGEQLVRPLHPTGNAHRAPVTAPIRQRL